MNKQISKDWIFPFKLLGKTWIQYLPGFEGLYAISEDLSILRLEHKTFTTDGKVRNYTNRILNRNISYGYAIQKDGKYEIFSLKKIKSLINKPHIS